MRGQSVRLKRAHHRDEAESRSSGSRHGWAVIVPEELLMKLAKIAIENFVLVP